MSQIQSSNLPLSKFILLLTLLFTFSNTYPQQAVVDSLGKQLSTQMPDTARLTLLKELTTAYSKVDPIKKLGYAKVYQSLAYKLNRNENVADAYIHMGISCGIRSKIDSALYYFNKAYIHAEKYGAKLEMGRSLANSAFAYTRLDDNKEAIDRYFRVLKIYNEIGYEFGLSQLYTNIGSIYFDLQEFNIANSYFQQALKINRKQKNETAIAGSLYSLGNNSREIKRYDEALKFYLQSLSIHERLGDLNGLALAKMGIGRTYTQLKNYPKALENLNAALLAIRKLNDKYIEINILNSLSDSYIGMQDYEKAIQQASIALRSAKDIKSKGITHEALQRLILAYSKKGDIKNAFNYQTESIKVRDSMREEKALKDVSLIEINRMRSENASLEKNNENITRLNKNYLNRIDEYSTLIIIALLFLIALLLFLTILYRRNIAKKTLNKGLREKSIQIADINRNLEMLNEELNAQMELSNKQYLELELLNNIKNKFFSIVSHDLRSPLNTLKSLMAIYREGNVTEQELAEMLLRLEDTILNTGAFLDNLLEWSKSQLEGIVISPINFDISTSIDYNIRLFESKINLKQLKVSNQAEKDSVVYADPNMINVVIRNLLSNSIKFCIPGDSIIFKTNFKDNKIEISINDSGPGISKLDSERLFNLDSTVSSTQGEKGNHLGLILCKDMVIQNNGTIRFESSPGDGTTFFIELPGKR